MIEIFEGKLGGGKTYNSVLRMAAHLRRGGVIYTNVEIVWEGLAQFVRSIYGVEPVPEQVHEIDCDDIPEFHKHLKRGTDKMNVLVVLDEIDLWFNARDHAQADRQSRALFEFIKLSRKVNIDIIFIAQSAHNMDRQFVRQVQYIWRFKDMSRLRMELFGALFGKLLGGYILCLCYDYDGRTVLEKKWLRKDLRIFKAYNTKAILKSTELPGEVASPFSLKRVSGVSRASLTFAPARILPPLRATACGVGLGLVSYWKIFV